MNNVGKILLVRRSEAKYGKTDGAWDIPGGRIEPGNSLFENLRREVREETGLEITSEPRLIAAQDIFAGTDHHIVRLSFVARTTGEPKLDISENTEYCWVTPDDLENTLDLNKFIRELLEDDTLGSASWD